MHYCSFAWSGQACFRMCMCVCASVCVWSPIRDYHDEITAHISGASQCFKPTHCQLWIDHAPTSSDVKAMQQADAHLAEITSQAAQLGWEQDTVKLAADIAMAGRLLEAEEKTSRARHLARVMHLKEQTFSRIKNAVQ